MKSFHSRGHLPQKPQTWRWSDRHLTQSRLQVKECTAERYCLLLLVVQGPGGFWCRSSFLYDVQLRSYGASKLPNFWILAYFPSQTKDEKVPFSDQPTAQGLHRRMIPIFHCGSYRSKGVPTGSGVFLRLFVGELGTSKVAQIFAYGKWLYPYKMRHIRCGANMSENTQFWGRMYFPTKYLHPYPENHPKPHFGDLSMQNLSRTLMELQSWNFTVI